MNATTVRYAAAVGSALAALLYLLIAFSVITVVEDQPGFGPPMLIAGVLFAGLAALLVLSARRIVFVPGAGLQVLVLLGYLAISAERTPAFEAWGITTKALQVLLLAAFVYLTLQSRSTAAAKVEERHLVR
jgi:hypothetical protein